jgi:hypothetical protein
VPARTCNHDHGRMEGWKHGVEVQEIEFKISVSGACFGTWRLACRCPKQMSSCSDIAEILHQSTKVEGQSRSGERSRKNGTAGTYQAPSFSRSFTVRLFS